MPMLWATVSCISRAMRSRSAVTACAAARAYSSSVWARAWRTELPMSQAMTTVRATKGLGRGPGVVPHEQARHEITGEHAECHRDRHEPESAGIGWPR